MKYCATCKTDKPISAFSLNRSRKDGLQHRCKQCTNEYSTNNKDKRRAYEIKNKEKRSARQSAYVAANRAKVLKYGAEYRAKNKDKYVDYYADYYAANKEKISAKGSKWYAENKEKIEAQKKIYNSTPMGRAVIKKARHKRRASIANAEGSHSASDIVRLMEAQGSKCACCKRAISEIYHVDHIEPLSKGGSNWPSNLQLLCPPCNQSKSDKNPEVFMQTMGYLL